MAASDERQKTSLDIVQLTDTHLGSSPDFLLAGVNTQISFSAVLNEVTDLASQPDLLVVSGDIAASAEPTAYQTFSSLMSGTELPYAWLPGNHDDFEMMQQHIAPQPFRQVIETEFWQLLFLNTAVSGQVGGSVDEAQLGFLQQQLASGSKHRAIFMHHPPVDVGCKWLDKQQVDNSERLREVLAASSGETVIFNGHVHQSAESNWHGVGVFSSPSTCVQFSRHSDEFSVSQQAPGYRHIRLFSDGSIDTTVHHLQHSTQKSDSDCVGY